MTSLQEGHAAYSQPEYESLFPALQSTLGLEQENADNTKAIEENKKSPEVLEKQNSKLSEKDAFDKVNTEKADSLEVNAKDEDNLEVKEEIADSIKVNEKQVGGLEAIAGEEQKGLKATEQQAIDDKHDEAYDNDFPSFLSVYGESKKESIHKSADALLCQENAKNSASRSEDASPVQEVLQTNTCALPEAKISKLEKTAIIETVSEKQIENDYQQNFPSFASVYGKGQGATDNGTSSYIAAKQASRKSSVAIIENKTLSFESIPKILSSKKATVQAAA